MQAKQEQSTTWLDKPILTNITLNWETLIFTALIILAFVTRFYDLESRVMSHDENSHVYYAWQLSQGSGYSHTPMTHGPYQFHIVALSYFLFGDNDFTARIPAALFGIATIFFLWYYRRYLGRVGTLVAAGLMLISPFLLYYARYVRNDIFSAFFGIVMLWAILRYLETGEAKYTYWLTAVTVLHFTTKETSFIYTAQALLFLGLLFVYQITKKRWEVPQYRNIFLTVLILAFVFMAVGVGLNAFIETPEPAAEEISTTLPMHLLIPIGLSGLAFMAALVLAIFGFTWDSLRNNRAFSLILLQLTLVLPQLAPFPARAVGWDALDYTTTGMLRTGIFIGILAAIAVVVGLLWDSRLWLINAAIFYIPFTIFYTTVFTNGAGFFTGMVGSLGYWIAQQGVERGSQPWYYYILVQIPVYEFLPLLGSILAGYYWIRLRGKTAPKGDDQAEIQADAPLEEQNQPRASAPMIPLLSFWSITSIIAYTIAGEKMPWLAVHIAWPLILLAGWGLGKLIERIDWDAVKT
ncbi:MAG: TIGR03663 family protein, partial [Chloroflexi bacterium]|nr:TIGR03663 family protein [Chloroflexota bacterium]